MENTGHKAEPFAEAILSTLNNSAYSLNLIGSCAELVNCDSKKQLTRTKGSGLLRNLNNFETPFITSLWCDILQIFNHASKKLQSTQLDLGS
ncbi:Hypothetical protein CINCED_3A011372, partial [Cinara cedri]